MIDDVSPSDPLVREHFGFIRVKDPNEETYLLSFYQGPASISRMSSAEVLQKWQRENTLAKAYLGVYSEWQSGCLKWFNSHQYFVGKNHRRPGGPSCVMREDPFSIARDRSA